jgi:single-stranded DNA-specific DHH superfamily exonuclease
MNNFYKKINEVKKNLNESKNILILFDTDTDGFTSYIQIKKYWKNSVGFPFFRDKKKQKRILEELKEYDFDTLLILDVPYLEEEFLSNFKNNKIIWVDHHPSNSKEIINNYNILNLNPLNFNKKDNRATSYISYLITDKKFIDWAVLGSVADFFLLDVISQLYKEDKKKFKLIFPNVKKCEVEEIIDFIKKYNFHDKRVSKKRASYIRLLTYKAGLINLKNFFDFLFRINDFNEIIKIIRKVEKLELEDLIQLLESEKEKDFEFYSLMKKEYKVIFEKAVKDLEKNKNKVFLWDYISKYSFTKTLSEELLYLYNKEIIGICHKKPNKDWYSCSFRSAKFKINEIISETVKKFNEAKGGGHPLACGANLKEKDYYKFKIKLYNQFVELVK